MMRRKGMRFPNGIPRVVTDIVGEGMSDKPPLSDIRDRIAAVLYRTYPPYQLGYSFGCPTEKWEDESEGCKEVYRRDADAVIAELGIFRHYLELQDDDLRADDDE